MADLSNNTACAVTVETTSGTFNAPNNSSDLIQLSNVTVAVDGITQTINEYTGSIHKPGAVVLGKTLTVTGRLYMRGPGGSTPPSAGAFVPGRILRAAAFAEVIVGTAIPASAEALAAGTQTQVTLGATPAGTANLYKGMMAQLVGLSSIAARRFTMLRSYSASKVALLAETAGSALNTTNYQIPKQLTYQLSPSADVPTLSVSIWHGSRRFDGVGMAISSFSITLPAASRANTELPYIDFTLTGDLEANADDTAPSLPVQLSIPAFRDGKLSVAGVNLGGSSVTINFNAQTAFPPNPNKISGNDAPQMASTERTASVVINQVAKATIDLIGLADAQTQHSLLAQWGSVSGNMFGVIITDGRFNYASPDAGAEFISNNFDMLIDGGSKDISIAVPFF